MKIQTCSFHTFEIAHTTDLKHKGIFIHLIDEQGRSAWGEATPLPKRSQETLEEALSQFHDILPKILNFEWTPDSYLQAIQEMNLFSSVIFGLESALSNLLHPFKEFALPTSALLMGSPAQILEQAQRRFQEGFSSAKLKVSNLSFQDAARLIHALKDMFRLRIDVNKAWNTSDSLNFFRQFPLDTFDYVEEPFQNSLDLDHFPHPLAIDESYPHSLSLQQLESLPTLKAIIYKPTLQGGMLACLPLCSWANHRNVKIVLSSSFESDLGLTQIALLAYRLNLTCPIGIGTYHYLETPMCIPHLEFDKSVVHVPATLDILHN